MISRIVNIINENFKNTFLKNQVFDNNIVFDVAQLIPVNKDEKLMLLPSVINEDGEAEYIGPDSDFDFMLYHRVLNIGVGANQIVKGFGDSKGSTLNSCKVSLVVFGNRSKLKLTNDELALLIQANFIETIELNVQKELMLRACAIKVNEIILSDLQVYNEEFELVPFFLKPEQYLFKINYTIENTFEKRCFTNI